MKNILKGKVVLLGIGNPLKGDDAIGPVIVNELAGKINAVCVDAGSAPENYLGKVAKEKPDTVLLIDAVLSDKEPGTYEILTKDEIIKSGFTTHDLSPHLVIEYLEKETHAGVYLLAIQPKTVEFGVDMSGEVQQAKQRIIVKIQESLASCTS